MIWVKFVPVQYSDNDEGVNLATAVKGTWKRQRTIMNPTFTPMKLKEAWLHFFYTNRNQFLDLIFFLIYHKAFPDAQ